MDEIITLINSTSFPIAMCCAFFWMQNNTIKANTAALIDLKTAIIELSRRDNK